MFSVSGLSTDTVVLYVVYGQVCVDKCDGRNSLSLCPKCITWHCLGYIAVYGSFPTKLFLTRGGHVRLIDSETNSAVLHLCEISNDLLCSIQVSSSGDML